MNKKTSSEQINFLEQMIALSVDLHNLNANAQRLFDLSIVQWLVLRKIINNPGISARNLATTSGVHPSTITPTLNRLDSMGLIFVFERSSDLRRKLIVASWKGFQCNEAMEKSFIESVVNIPLEFQLLKNFEKISDIVAEISKTWVSSPVLESE